MSTYLELKQQAEALLAQAEQARQAETKAVLNSITEQMRQYGLTLQDLERHLGNKPGKPANAAKYRDPHSGKTWTGKGRAPQWLPKEKTLWGKFEI